MAAKSSQWRNNMLAAVLVALTTATYLGLYLGTMEAYVAWALMAVASVVLLAMGAALFRAKLKQFSVAQTLVLAIAVVAIFIGNYAILYRNYGILNGDAPVSNANDFLYFSIVTWTTLGYGDFKPSEGARLVAASEALIGYATMVITVGISGQNIANALKELYAGDNGQAAEPPPRAMSEPKG